MTAFTAPDGATVMPNGAHIAPGAQVNLPAAADVANMGPTERFNAFAKAYGAPPVEVPLSERIAASKAAPPSATSRTPPSPQELEASRIAGFDAEMRAKGIQKPLETPPPARANNPVGYETAANGMHIPNGAAVDTAAYGRLNQAYRTRLAEIAVLPEAQRESALINAKADHEAKLAQILPGVTPGAPAAPPTQPTGDYLGPDDADSPYWNQPRLDGNGQLTKVGQQLEARIRAEFAAGTPAEQSDPGNIDATNVALVSVRQNEHGMVPVEAFHPGMLHGYTLPKLLPDQHYPAETIRELAAARAAGVTQAQVDAYVRNDMRNRGYKV